MASVGALTVDLSANTAAFKSDLSKAQTALRSGTSRMNRSLATLDRGFARAGASALRMAKSMTSFHAIIGAVAGTAGLGLLVRQSLDAADAIAKTADSIGISTGALQELRFAAELSGVSTENLDSAMQAFSKRVGELRAGTGVLTTLLGKMDEGFKAQVQSAGSVDQAFDLVIRRAASMGNQMDRNALLAAAFGRTAGVQMSNMIKKGTASLDDMRKEARRLGAVIDADLLRKSEQAKDEMFKVSQVISSSLTTAVITFAPEIKTLAQNFAELVKWMKVANDGFKAMADRGVARLQYDLKGVNEHIASIQAKLAKGGHAAYVRLLKEDLAKYQTIAGQLQARIDKLQRDAQFPNGPPAGGAGTGSGAPAAGGVSPAQARANKLLKTFPPMTAAESMDPFGGFGQAAADAAQRARDLGAESKKAAEDGLKRMREEGQRLKEAVNPTAAYAAQMVHLRELLGAGAIDMDTFQRAAKQATDRLGEQTRQTNTLATAIDDVLGAAINGQIRSWQDLGRVALGVLQQILTEQLRVANAANSVGGGGSGGGLFGKLFSPVLSLFGGGGSSSLSFGNAGGFNAVSQQAFSGQFASGGRPPVGRPAIVGENGPEVFVPDRAGTIIPNSGTAGARPTIYIDARGSNGDAAVEAAVERGIRRAAPHLVNASVEKVRNRIKRDPAYTR